MIIGILNLDFHINGSHSLKEKRKFLRQLKDKYGHITNIAVCECDFQDSWQRGGLAFVCTSTDKAVVESTLSKIKSYCQLSGDAQLVNDQIEWIYSE